MMVQPPQTHNHGNMNTMGKVDTSDLMMLVINALQIYSLPHHDFLHCQVNNSHIGIDLPGKREFFPWERMSTTHAVSVLQKEVLYHLLFP